MQPEEHALDEGLCNPEPDLIAEAGKQSPPDFRSSTCMPLTFGETVDFDTADVGTNSRHSFFSKSLADGTDHSRPPNRILHDHHNSRMEGFLKAAWVILQTSHAIFSAVSRVLTTVNSIRVLPGALGFQGFGWLRLFTSRWWQ